MPKVTFGYSTDIGQTRTIYGLGIWKQYQFFIFFIHYSYHEIACRHFFRGSFFIKLHVTCMQFYGNCSLLNLQEKFFDEGV